MEISEFRLQRSSLLKKSLWKSLEVFFIESELSDRSSLRMFPELFLIKKGLKEHF